MFAPSVYNANLLGLPVIQYRGCAGCSCVVSSLVDRYQVIIAWLPPLKIVGRGRVAARLLVLVLYNVQVCTEDSWPQGSPHALAQAYPTVQLSYRVTSSATRVRASTCVLEGGKPTTGTRASHPTERSTGRGGHVCTNSSDVMTLTFQQQRSM